MEVEETEGRALQMWERFVCSRGEVGATSIDVGIWSISCNGRGRCFSVSEKRDYGGWSHCNIPAAMALLLWSGIEAHHADYGEEPLVLPSVNPFRP